MSTSPSASRRSNRARSSGNWPITVSLRSFGCTSISRWATLRSPQNTTGWPSPARRPACAMSASRKRIFAREVLAAVRHVDGRDAHAADECRHDAGFVIEVGMGEHRLGRAAGLAHEERDARVGALPVPVGPVVGKPAERRGNLLARRLQLLQADDVRLLAADPLDQLRLARADAVDVPGRDLHCVFGSPGPHTLPCSSWQPAHPPMYSP